MTTTAVPTPNSDAARVHVAWVSNPSRSSRIASSGTPRLSSHARIEPGSS